MSARTRLERLVLVAAAGVVSACIPARDNKNDPALAPKAALTWDAAPFDRVLGMCGTSDEIKPAVTSRGRCLHLDASGSLLHDDSAVTRFRYLLEYDGADVEDSGIVPASSWDFTPATLVKY